MFGSTYIARSGKLNPSPGTGRYGCIFGPWRCQGGRLSVFYREKCSDDGSANKKLAAAFFAKRIRHFLQHWQWDEKWQYAGRIFTRRLV